MGIPRFFGTWLRNKTMTGILQKSPPPYISSLSIDMNSLFHKMAQMIFGYGEFSNDKRVEEIRNTPLEQLYTEMYVSIENELLRIINMINPRDIIILAVDGVAPNAKIVQQRQRRFRSSSERGADQKFDSNAITPGTEFMRKLDAHLRNWLSVNNSVLPPKIIYSSHMVPGEGEHKIMDLYRDNYITEKGTHIVYGMDADLIMLSLLSPLDNILMFREDIDNFINIDNFRQYLYDRLQTDSAIGDFVVLSFLLGNDFLPHPPALEDLGWSLEQLIELYIDINRSSPLPLSTECDIIWDNMIKYLVRLSQIESTLIEHEAIRNLKREPRLQSTILKESTRNVTQYVGLQVAGTKYVIDYPQFRNKWYLHALKGQGKGDNNTDIPELILGEEPFPVDPEIIIDMATAYLTGIGWTYKYYTGGINNININWIYPYNYSPMISDLSQVDIENLNQYEPDPDNPPVIINPVHQLLSVLPRRSIHLLPKEVQFLMSSDNSDIADLYPSKFDIDFEGKSADWQGIVLIPCIDIDRIITAVNTHVLFPAEIAQLFFPDNDILISREVTLQPYPSTGGERGRGQERRQERGRGRGRGERGGRGRGRGGQGENIMPPRRGGGYTISRGITNILI